MSEGKGSVEGNPKKGKADVLSAAFDIYLEHEKITRKEFMKKIAAAVPDLSDKEYDQAWTRVSNLFDQACRLAFRWANENEPGAEIDFSVVENLFVTEIAKKCQGFTFSEYSRALSYGFEKGIF